MLLEFRGPLDPFDASLAVRRRRFTPLRAPQVPVPTEAVPTEAMPTEIFTETELRQARQCGECGGLRGRGVFGANLSRVVMG